MPVDACRVCGHKLYGQALLVLENMPKAAQFLPDAEALATERGEGLEVSQCPNCGLVQLTNDPVPYYREVIRAAAVSAEVARQRTEQLQGFVQRFDLTGKKVVEIGCGRGEFLSILQRCPVEAFGIEASQASVDQCLASGLRVTCDYVDREDQRLEDGPFDAFLLLMFLEHFPAPNVVLRGLRSNLADGAVGVVEVPNFDMILREGVFSEFIGDHLLYFTQQTLEQTLAFNGFELLESSVLRGDYVLHALVRKRQMAVLSHFHRAREQLKTDLNRFLRRFPKGTVAVWGAGHQALAVLSLTHIADRVRFVVDSAPFKQGKFTPATHIPIVAPDALLATPVDAILVMAASYSDEVIAIIRERYSKELPIAVLRKHGLEELVDCCG